MTVYEPSKASEKIRGLRITVHGEDGQNSISLLDMDEAESLSQAITYMINLLHKWKGKSREDTDVIFHTKDGFELHLYQEGTNVGACAGSDGVFCAFSTDDFPDLKAIIDKGRSLLAQ